MPWVAAFAMTAVYFFSIPVVLAVVWEEGKFAAAFRPFSPRAALKTAAMRARGEKKRVDRKKTEKGLSRLMLPLRTAGTVREILPRVTFEYFRLDMRVGLDDAALTAAAFSAIAALGNIAAARAERTGGVRVTPDFNNFALEGSACAVFSVRIKDAVRAAVRAAPYEEDTPIARMLEKLHGFAALRRGGDNFGDIAGEYGE